MSGATRSAAVPPPGALLLELGLFLGDQAAQRFAAVLVAFFGEQVLEMPDVLFGDELFQDQPMMAAQPPLVPRNMVGSAQTFSKRSHSRQGYLCQAIRPTSAGTRASARQGVTRTVKSVAGREAGTSAVKM